MTNFQINLNKSVSRIVFFAGTLLINQTAMAMEKIPTAPITEDDALKAAIIAFNKASTIRQQMEKKHDSYKFVIFGKEEVDDLEICVKNLLRSHFLTANYILLYKVFSRFIQLKAAPPACMLCLEEGHKIAASHYVPSCILKHIGDNIVVPGINRIIPATSITLPLFCRAVKGGVSRCEQLMSSEGEEKFSKFFLKFITNVREARKSNSVNIQSLNYDSWLFHCITSIAWRVFISDLDNEENWLTRSESDPSLRGASQSLWNFFLGMREYMLAMMYNRSAHLKHRIKLYLSAPGLAGSKELPMTLGIGSALAMPETDSPLTKQWLHWVLFSIQGFHFLILANEETEILLSGNLGLPDDAFQAAIGHRGGRLDILPNCRAILPSLVEAKLKEYTKHHMAEMLSTYDSQVVAESLAKMKQKTPHVTINRFQGFVPRHIIMLPDYLRFLEGDDSKVWCSGRILSLNEFVQPIGFFEIRNSACWLFKHGKANFDFAIIHLGNEERQHDLVFGYEFDIGDFVRAGSKVLDFKAVMKKLKVLRDTSHTDLVLSVPEYPAVLIALTLLESSKTKKMQEDLKNFEPPL